MLRSTKILAAYLVVVAAPLAASADACDNQSDDGSMIISLGGTSETTFEPGSATYGTYKTVAKGKTRGAVKAKCKWRTLVPIPGKPGKFFQTSPTKAGSWHHLNGLYKGSIKIGPVTDPKYKGQPRILVSVDCPKWVMKK